MILDEPLRSRKDKELDLMTLDEPMRLGGDKELDPTTLGEPLGSGKRIKLILVQTLGESLRLWRGKNLML